jgi:hypothetical protein
MGTVYLVARSYQDTGVVTEVRRGGLLGEGTLTKPFRTSFVRPDVFYDHFASKQNGSSRRYVVWADGKRVRSWWSIRPEVKHFDSIGPALYGPLGVSGGSAHTIPRLLLADSMTTTFAITQMGNPKTLKDENIAGTPCRTITGSDIGMGTVTVWIGKKDSLVRKIVRQTAGLENTTTYKPRINVPIKTSEFVFTPPALIGDL